MVDMTRPHRSAAWATALTVLLVACGGGSDSTSVDTRSEATGVAETDPVEPQPADTEVPTTDGNDTVDAGRCGVIVGDGEYDPIDCAEPHDAEFAGLTAARAGTDSVSLMTACGVAVGGLTGRPVVEFGIDVGAAVIDGGDEIECWAEASAEGTLSASILDDGLDAALGDFVFITDLPDGSCYRLADPEEDSFDIATDADCDDPSAEMIYGQFEADDGPVPDDDTTNGFFARCDELAAEAAFDLIGNSTYIISPLDDNWEALDRRTVLCITWTDPDLEPAEEFVDFDPAAAVGPVCANYDDDLADYPPVPCDEPHTSEYAGSVTPPPGNLPADEAEATIVLRTLCRDAVETLTGRSLSVHGSGVGFVSLGGLGEPMVQDIRCYLSIDVDGIMTGAVSEIGYENALNHEIIGDLEPGTCFTFAGEEAFDYGDVVPCDAADALMALGSFVVEDPPGTPHPGDDALRALRTERCGEILASSDLAADPSTVSGTFPGDQNWVAFDRRQVTCDAMPLRSVG